MSAKSKNTAIKASRGSKVLGRIAGSLMKLWGMTLRYRMEDKKGVLQPELPDDPVIFALWHNRIFTMPPIWQRTGGKFRKSKVLTSASKDGTILATAMECFGLGAIRGSSSRRAVSALIGMKKALKEGYDVCVTPDGPKGPCYQVQPGVIKIAQATGTEIVPIHVKFSSAWRLNSWDRFAIPKPFSKVEIVFDSAITVPKEHSEEEFEKTRMRLESLLREETGEF